MRLVSAVTRTRSPLAARTRISPSRSSTWPATGRISTTGSIRPVGRTICSATQPAAFSSSYGAGVAEM